MDFGLRIADCQRTIGKPTIVPERKLGFFVQIKEGENFNRRNTLSISRIKI